MKKTKTKRKTKRKNIKSIQRGQGLGAWVNEHPILSTAILSGILGVSGASMSYGYAGLKADQTTNFNENGSTGRITTINQYHEIYSPFNSSATSRFDPSTGQFS